LRRKEESSGEKKAATLSRIIDWRDFSSRDGHGGTREA
jgi:hypothetical protein